MKQTYQPPKLHTNLARWIRWAGSAISAVLFLWLLTRQDWGEVLIHLNKIPAWVFPIALALYLMGMVANAIRWHVLLQAPNVNIPPLETVKIVFAGAFASNFLPSTIGGDALRVISLLRYTPNRGVSLASIILDRIINVTAFFTILPLTFATFGSPVPLLREMLSNERGTSPLAYSGVFSIGQKLLARGKRWIERGRETFQIWIRRPWIVGKAFIVSWISIFVIFVAIWVLAQGLAIPVALYQVMGVTVITYLITLLPISVNGYGLREIVLTGLYSHLGASTEQATTLAVITRFMSMSVTLPGALWIAQSLTLAKQSTTGAGQNQHDTIGQESNPPTGDHSK